MERSGTPPSERVTSRDARLRTARPSRDADSGQSPTGSESAPPQDCSGAGRRARHGAGRASTSARAQAKASTSGVNAAATTRVRSAPKSGVKSASTSGTKFTRPLPNDMADHGGQIVGLDGLRALAVGAVILYHVFPGVFQGGFLGVDLFFVISGFLITTLLLREDRRNNYIDLKGFWTRRIRRLIPALVTLILVVVPTAWAVNSDLLVGMRRQVLGALTFSTNWLEIAHGSDYFDQTSPLLFKNFWSLAIEEQFYLIWPIAFLAILVLLPKWWHRAILSGALALGSAALMALMYDPSNLTRLYYGTDTHLFGLAIGITLAFIWSDPEARVLGSNHWRKFSSVYGWVALGVVVVAMFVMPDQGAFAYRGGMFGVSLFAAIAIAAMLTPGSHMARLGETRVLHWIGTRSYGLYLWHWPVIVIAAALVPVAQGSVAYWVRSLIAVVIAGICAELSFRYVETPIRRRGFKECFAEIKGQLAGAGGSGSGGASSGSAAAELAGSGSSAAGHEGSARTGSPRSDSAHSGTLHSGSSRPGTLRSGSSRPGTLRSGSSRPGILRSGSSRPSATVTAARVGATVVVALLIGTVAALIVSPAQSSTATQIQDAQDEIDAQDGSAEKDGNAAKNGGAEKDESAAQEGTGGQGDTSGDPKPASTEAQTLSADLDPSVPSADEITAIGDSMVVASKTGLEAAMPGMNFVAKSNRQWADAPGVVQEAVDNDQVGRVVVLDFGTNAGVPEPDDVRTVLNILGPERMVVLVNLYSPSTFIADSNEHLEAIAAEYPNVYLADWHSVAEENPRLLQLDETHPSIEGANAYGALVEDSIHALSADLTAKLESGQ